jgi:hypothetical protein
MADHSRRSVIPSTVGLTATLCGCSSLTGSRQIGIGVINSDDATYGLTYTVEKDSTVLSTGDLRVPPTDDPFLIRVRSSEMASGDRVNVRAELDSGESGESSVEIDCPEETLDAVSIRIDDARLDISGICLTDEYLG